MHTELERFPGFFRVQDIFTLFPGILPTGSRYFKNRGLFPFSRYRGNHGMVRLACIHKSKVTETMFYVVEGNVPPFISLQTSIDLGLLQLTYAVERTFKQSVNQLIERDYADLFKDIEVIPGEVKLHLKDDAVPVVNPPRRVPEALKSRLKDELDTMESDQIIRKVTEPTYWENSLEIVLENSLKNWQTQGLLGSKSLKHNDSKASLPNVDLRGRHSEADKCHVLQHS